MNSNTHILDCKVCNSKDSVKFSLKENDDHIEIKVGKCENCKHQHGIKELCRN